MKKSIKPAGLAEIMPKTYNDNTEKQTKTRQQSSMGNRFGYEGC